MFNVAGSFEIKRDKSLFYTGYKPSPLCTNDFVKIDEELAYFLNNAHREIGILEGMSTALKDIDIYEAMFRKKRYCILAYWKKFLTISPFEDENKKLSRILINILLKKYNLLSKDLICMSRIQP